MHDIVRHLVPDVLGCLCGKALVPSPYLPLPGHSPALVSMRILLIEDSETSYFFLSSHTLETRLGNRPSDHVLPVVQPSPRGDLGVGSRPGDMVRWGKVKRCGWESSVRKG